MRVRSTSPPASISMVAEFTVEFDAPRRAKSATGLHNEVSESIRQGKTGIPRCQARRRRSRTPRIRQGAITNASTTIKDVEEIDGDG